MGLTWRPWTSVSEGSSPPGAPVAAVPWGDSFALFIADPGGSIYAIKAGTIYVLNLGRTAKRARDASNALSKPSSRRFLTRNASTPISSGVGLCALSFASS